MPTATMTREYPIDRKALFDHVTDPATWPSFYSGLTDVDVPDRFDEPGHRATLRYRVLGRIVDVESELLEYDPPNRFRTRAQTPGLPPVEHDWHYEDTDGGTKVTVTLTSHEVDSWLGRTLDRFVLPRQLEKDLERSLDNVEGLVEFGIH
jgi:uncharacterized protein YndB with AHSA1/START domain